MKIYFQGGRNWISVDVNPPFHSQSSKLYWVYPSHCSTHTHTHTHTQTHTPTHTHTHTHIHTYLSTASHRSCIGCSHHTALPLHLCHHNNFSPCHTACLLTHTLLWHDTWSVLCCHILPVLGLYSPSPNRPLRCFASNPGTSLQVWWNYFAGNNLAKKTRSRGQVLGNFLITMLPTLVQYGGTSISTSTKEKISNP